MWPWLGIEALDTSTVEGWMLTNLDRAHLYVPAGHDVVLASLEVYDRARVGSVFEARHDLPRWTNEADEGSVTRRVERGSRWSRSTQ